MEENKIFRVGIYLRLSDEDRNKSNKDDDSESIKNQRNLLVEEIKKRGNFVLVDEYCDEDLSGAGTYRPQFERLINDCEHGKLDIVLCKSQSRFSRDMEIVEKYIHNKFNEWNIRFIGLSDNADTDNYGNKKSRQINGLVNEWYLEDVSNNIRSAFKAKMINGEYISPFASYGYRISSDDKNKLVIDEEAAVIVRDIFYLYLSGVGFMGIAKRLNDRNIASPSLYKYRKGIKLNIVSNNCREDIKWSSSAVKRILTNEIYIGNLIQGKRTTISYKNHKIKNKLKSEWIKKENTHDAIIDKDIFNKVQFMIKERTRGVKNGGNIHIFSGKVFCLKCGKYMRKKNSGKYDYLVCSGSEYNLCCNKDSIRYDILEKIILEKINEKIEMFYDKEKIQGKFNLKRYDKFLKKINLLENKKSELESKLFKNDNYLKFLYEDRVNGVISANQFEYLINNYNDEIEKNQNEIELLNNDISFYRKNLNNEDILFDGSFDNLNRFMIEELINRIYIGVLDNEKYIRDVQIEWNF